MFLYKDIIKGWKVVYFDKMLWFMNLLLDCLVIVGMYYGREWLLNYIEVVFVIL